MSAVEDIKAASSELLTAPPAKALLRFALPLMAGGACQPTQRSSGVCSA